MHLFANLTLYTSSAGPLYTSKAIKRDLAQDLLNPGSEAEKDHPILIALVCLIEFVLKCIYCLLH